jgi:hypothetical protein
MAFHPSKSFRGKTFCERKYFNLIAGIYWSKKKVVTKIGWDVKVRHT